MSAENDVAADRNLINLIDENDSFFMKLN